MTAVNPRLAASPYNNITVHTINAVIDDVAITWDEDEEGGSAGVGLAVTVSDDGPEITLAGDSEPVLGLLTKVEEDGYATVAKGAIPLPGGDSAVLTPGKRIIGDLGAAAAEGYIQACPDAATPTAAEVNQVLASRGEILDATTTTAVVVWLL